jgi:hypothetical protein
MDELDGMLLKAAEIDAAVDASAPQAMAEAQQAADVMSMADMNTRAVAGVLEMAAPMIAPLYPSVAAVYTPAVCEQVGGALGPVLAKYGIDLGEWGGKWKEEITALFVCVPIMLETVKAVKADIAARVPPPAVGQGGEPSLTGAG